MKFTEHALKAVIWAGGIATAAGLGYWWGRIEEDREQRDTGADEGARPSSLSTFPIRGPTTPPGFTSHLPPTPPGAGAAATVQQTQPTTLTAHINNLSDESKRRLARKLRRARSK